MKQYDNAIVTRFFADKGFGFVWSKGMECNAFVHISDCQNKSSLERGDIVSCKCIKTERGYQAKEIQLVDSGRKRVASHVGITSWSGPGCTGEYGVAINKMTKDADIFVHKSCLTDRTTKVVSSCLYRMDIAEYRNGYIGLNVRKLSAKEPDTLEKLARSPSENPFVKLKAQEMLAKINGEEEEFFERIKRQIDKNPQIISSETKIKLPGIEFSQKGEPSERTYKIVKAVIIGGCIIGTIGLAKVLVNKVSE